MASYRTFRGRPAITGNTDLGFKQSNANYPEAGFGQVEPNHLSAQRNGQTYAQLPMSKTIPMLENGQFIKYDYANNEVNFTGDGEWMLVYNEVKVYREGDSDADFAMINTNYAGPIYDATGKVFPDASKADGTMNPVVCPRVFKTMPGDIYTTNMINAAESNSEITLPAVGDKFTPGTDGILAPVADGATPDMIWKVVKVYTMPDLQRGVKLQRIK